MALEETELLKKVRQLSPGEQLNVYLLAAELSAWLASNDRRGIVAFALVAEQLRERAQSD